MRHTRSCCAAVLAAALLTPFAHATEKTPVTPVKLSRKNLITEAVENTKAGVVAIRVPRPGHKDMVGSGVIVDESGVIITNRHVTGGKRDVKVRLHDGTDLIGHVVLTDPDIDLAVVRITTSTKLTALPLAPVSDLMVGETVLAIGSPYGYDATVSRGIISALNRDITMPNDVTITGLIQHDAPINPGNSGGPLVNINSEVIGINVAMRDGAQNIAFSINSAMVKGFLTKYFSAKRVAGVEHGFKTEEKVVAEVGDRQRVVLTAAAHDALKSGDQIVTVGKVKVANEFDIERAFWHSRPGQKVELKVNRDGRELTVQLTLAASQGAGPVAVLFPESSTASSAVATMNVRQASQK